MKKWIALLWIGTCILRCRGRDPFRPRHGSMPYIVYFASRHRGLCVGTLVSRTAVITTLVCVANPTANTRDTRPINIVVGSDYRHPRRGIRVQVTKILIQNLRNIPEENRAYYKIKSSAILLLKRQVPDILVEIPLRPIKIDYKGEEVLNMHDECLMPGWHFFYKGDRIFPVHKFLLQKNLRVQYLSIAKKSVWCEALAIKLQKASSNLGFLGYIDRTSSICVRDPDRRAQPCHGMYGAPLICKGKAVGMLMAPDAQWYNCTGFSNLIHLFAEKNQAAFMACVSSLFSAEEPVNWYEMQKLIRDDLSEEYDPLPELYDRLDYKQSSISSEEL